MEQKTCPKCGETKGRSEFGRKKSTKDGWQCHCKVCRREYSRKQYANNPEPFKQRAKENRQEIRRFLVDFISSLRKEKGCHICGEKEECVLDFHHVKPGNPVTRMISKGYTALEKELAKCVVVCANCHRKIHAGLIEADKSQVCNDIKVPRRQRYTD